MTPPGFTRILVCLFLVNSALVTTLNRPLSAVKSVRVGDGVTLPCQYRESAVMFFWYKQTVAQKPQLVSSYYKHNSRRNFHGEFKDNPRFSLDDKNSLKISDLHVSDSAMYFCGSSNLANYYFAEVVTVSVEGSGVNLQTLVRQSDSESVHPGDSATLNCTLHTGTCDGGHSVHWFKSYKEEPQPGIIYTHGGTGDRCGKKNDTQTHTCVYDLPIQSADHTHDGTYCAVASCGQVLFGNRNRLDLHDMKESFAMLYFLSGALAFTTTLIVLLTFSAFQLKKRIDRCTESDERDYENITASASKRRAKGYRKGDILQYAAILSMKPAGPRGPADDVWSECVYFNMEQ